MTRSDAAEEKAEATNTSPGENGEPVSRPCITVEEMLAHLPQEGKYAEGPLRPEQFLYVRAIADGKGLIEGPTGSGKSLVEYLALCAAHTKYGGPAFWVAPTKGIVDQLHRDFPELPVLLGSNEIPCMFAAAGFDPQKSAATKPDQLLQMYADPCVPRRDQVPCAMLPCPHRVNVQTGETREPGVLGCQYYRQEYAAKQDGRALATMSFYLYARVFGGRSQKFDVPTVLVIDEAHRLPDILRHSLSYEITDWYVVRSADLLERIGAEKDSKVLRKFLAALKRIAKARKRESCEEHLLEEEEIRRLIDVLSPIDTDELTRRIQQAINDKKVNVREECTVIKKLETLTRDIRRYVHAFEYSLSTEQRPALNYTCAFYRLDRGDHGKVQYKLVIRCHHVAPLVRKRLIAPLTLAFSATIVNPKIFEWDSGVGGEFFYLDTYDPRRRRLYVPADVHNLSYTSGASHRDKSKTLKRIAEACLYFAREGYRSLVIVVANSERTVFLDQARRIGLDAVSYGRDVSARDIAAAFKEGHGQTLVGTEAQYAEGLDLPGKMAPVIFVLRPAYADQRSAEAQFEVRRWPKEPNRVWALRNRRAMVKAFQACGRNVRGCGPEDGGVTFFMDERFRKLVAPALPDSLKPAYRGNLKFQECLSDALSLLSLVFGMA